MAMVAQTDAPTTRGEIGVGVYSLQELRAYVVLMSGDQADARRVGGWLDYPLNPVPHERWQADYSFADLISLFVVRHLLRAGVEPRDIHSAERHLRRSLATDRPFLNADIQTDGCHVWWRDEVVPGQIEDASLEGQQAMVELIREKLTRVHYSGGWATYWSPHEHIVLNPQIQFGEPTIEGTRLQVDLVVEAVRRLHSKDAVAKRFSISSDAVASAVEFKEHLAVVTT